MQSGNGPGQDVFEDTPYDAPFGPVPSAKSEEEVKGSTVQPTASDAPSATDANTADAGEDSAGINDHTNRAGESSEPPNNIESDQDLEFKSGELEGLSQVSTMFQPEDTTKFPGVVTPLPATRGARRGWRGGRVARGARRGGAASRADSDSSYAAQLYPGIRRTTVPPRDEVVMDATLTRTLEAVQKLGGVALEDTSTWQHLVDDVMDGMRTIQRKWQILEAERKALTKPPTAATTSTATRGYRGRGRGRGRRRGRWRGL